MDGNDNEKKSSDEREVGRVRPLIMAGLST